MSDQDALWTTGRKNSGIGVSSFVTSVAAVALLALAFIIWFSNPDGLVVGTPESIMFAIAAIFAVAFGLVAFALGIASLFQKEKKKYLAILGMFFSSPRYCGAGVISDPRNICE